MKKFRDFLMEGEFAYSIKFLEDLYDKFNKLYFDNELPKIKIQMNSRSKSMARTAGMQTGSKIVPEMMEFSSLFNLTADQLYGIMLHEMIHVYLFLRGKKGHDVYFKIKLSELQSKVNFKILTVEDNEALFYGDKLSTKKHYIIFVDYPPVHDGIIKISKKLFDDIEEMDNFAKTLFARKKIKRAVLGSIILGEFSKVPEKRNISTFDVYKLADVVTEDEFWKKFIIKKEWNE